MWSYRNGYCHVSFRRRMPGARWRMPVFLCHSGKMATQLNSLFVVFTTSFLPNCCAKLNHYIVKWCSCIAYKGPFTIVNIYVFVQSVRRGEGGTRPAYKFLNVDIFELLPPGGYDWETAAPHNGLLRDCCYLQERNKKPSWKRFYVRMPPCSFGLTPTAILFG